MTSIAEEGVQTAEAGGGIGRLIINSPYEEPTQHWSYNRNDRKFELMEDRREAGYLTATPDSKSFDDPGIFRSIELANKIRSRVTKWRESNYPGVSGITKRLLEHWQQREHSDDKRLFFCQLEAAETLIWLAEAPDVDKVGIDVPSDGGNFSRFCSKMATGSGKTVVMSMVIAWHVLNKVSSPQDTRFSKNILIIAPGLTVRNRLAVLDPNNPENYYEEFNIVPSELRPKLRQGKVVIHNWHVLGWESEEKLAQKKSVVRLPPQSDESYVRGILGDMASSRNLVVINDEAHHAWRVPSDAKPGQYGELKKDDLEEATRWVAGLDRIHETRRILQCYDFSATPFVPTGKKNVQESLFEWIVSDFSLNDAIEAGLVKTPRVVVRDNTRLDAKTYKSRLYHIFGDKDVATDLKRKAGKKEPLPGLVEAAYQLLGDDWQDTYLRWQKADRPVTPVMISVTNRTDTAARIKYFFDQKSVAVAGIPELCEPKFNLHIDSKVLKEAELTEEPIGDLEGVDFEAEDEELTKNQKKELLRQKVDTIGKPGKPGEHIRHVISVQMLSEGWDAKTVTHIMGLRAFTSQLLCEQVVGRGLRRTSYDVNEEGLFEPEYVNIFGVPFTFLPHESYGDNPPLRRWTKETSRQTLKKLLSRSLFPMCSGSRSCSCRNLLWIGTASSRSI